MRMKGQYTIVALIATFMTMIAYAVMYPVLMGFLNPLILNITTSDPYTATMLQLVPFFIILSIVLTVIFIVIPVREV
jgi:uncharacterized BrkB/YihY/UPF0761 family membrane protein